MEAWQITELGKPQEPLLLTEAVETEPVAGANLSRRSLLQTRETLLHAAADEAGRSAMQLGTAAGARVIGVVGGPVLRLRAVCLPVLRPRPPGSPTPG